MSFRLARNTADFLGEKAGQPTYKGELACPCCGTKSDIYAGVFDDGEGGKYFSGQTVPKGQRATHLTPELRPAGRDLFDDKPSGMWPAKGAR